MIKDQTSASRLLCGIASSLWLVGCADALVDGTYRGEPLLTLSGQVLLVPNLHSTGGKRKPPAKPRDSGDGKEATSQQGLKLPQGSLRLAIVWEATSINEGIDQSLSTVEQSVVLTAAFPARYSLTIFTPPSRQLLHSADQEGSYALGTILAYADTDEDGTYDGSVDVLVGGAAGRALLYTPEGVSASWLSQPLAGGYHRMRAKADKAQCDTTGHARLELDADVETDLKVYEQFPKDALLDLNCDGRNDEWKHACPPRKHLKKWCALKPASDWACNNCPR